MSLKAPADAPALRCTSASRAVLPALAFLTCLNLALGPPGTRLPVCVGLVAAVVCLLGRGRAGWSEPPPIGRADRWLAAGLLALALSVRLTLLEQCPPLPSTDEGINGDIALEILQGRGPGFLLSGFGVDGEEAAVFYLHAHSFRLFGPSLWAFRLPAAVAGALMLPLLYFLCRQRCSRAAAALACAVCAVNPAHLLFSRMANSIVYPATFQALAFLWLPRVLDRRRPIDFALLGVGLGLGLNTYPSFRIIPLIVLGVLAWDGWRRRDRGGMTTGVALVTAIVAGALLLQLATPECRAAYLGRLAGITVAGRTPGEAVRTFVEALPSTLGIGLGWTATSEGFLLVSPAVGALALVGLAGWLTTRAAPALRLEARGSRLEERLASPVDLSRQSTTAARSSSGCRRDVWPPTLLPALLLTGLLPPLVTVFEPIAARRFLQLLVPLHLLLAMGLDRLLDRWRETFSGAATELLLPKVVAPREESGKHSYSLQPTAYSLSAGEARAVPWLAAMGGLVLGLCLLSGQRLALARIGCNVESRPLELSLAASAARLSRERTVVLSRSSVRQPFVAGRQSMAPELNFFLRAYPLKVAFGLNPYPILDPVPRVDFVLAQPEWRVALGRAFPGGRLVDWRDPDNPDQCLHLYSVAGEEAFRLQGLEKLPRGERRGAIYLGNSGSWAFELDAVRGWLRLDEQTSPVRNGRACLAGWYSEGWHSLAYKGTPGPIRLAWQPPEASCLREVLGMNLLRRIPADSQVRASPVVSSPIGLEPVSSRWWHEKGMTGLLQAVAVAGDRVTLLRPGPASLVPLEPNAAWKGLRTRQGTGLVLAEQSSSSGMLYSLEASPEGELYVADPVAGRLLRVSPDGLIKLELRYGPGGCLPSSLDFEPVVRRVLVADAREGRLLVLDEHLRKLEEWRCPGVTAACWGNSPGVVHAVVPRRGGLARLQHGRETGFWRMIEASTLSRIACDKTGRVLVLASLGRLQVFDSEGRILLPLTRLPNPDGRAGDGPPPLGVAVVPLGGDELAVGYAGSASAWMRLSLGRAPAVPFHHEQLERPR